MFYVGTLLRLLTLYIEVRALSGADCESDGIYPDKTNCSRFYICAPYGPELFHCPEGLHFNINLLVCDWPYRAGCVPINIGSPEKENASESAVNKNDSRPSLINQATSSSTIRQYISTASLPETASDRYKPTIQISVVFENETNDNVEFETSDNVELPTKYPIIGNTSFTFKEETSSTILNSTLRTLTNGTVEPSSEVFISVTENLDGTDLKTASNVVTQGSTKSTNRHYTEFLTNTPNSVTENLDGTNLQTQRGAVTQFNTKLTNGHYAEFLTDTPSSVTELKFTGSKQSTNKIPELSAKDIYGTEEYRTSTSKNVIHFSTTETYIASQNPYNFTALAVSSMDGADGQESLPDNSNLRITNNVLLNRISETAGILNITDSIAESYSKETSNATEGRLNLTTEYSSATNNIQEISSTEVSNIATENSYNYTYNIVRSSTKDFNRVTGRLNCSTQNQTKNDILETITSNFTLFNKTTTNNLSIFSTEYSNPALEALSNSTASNLETPQSSEYTETLPESQSTKPILETLSNYLDTSATETSTMITQDKFIVTDNNSGTSSSETYVMEKQSISDLPKLNSTNNIVEGQFNSTDNNVVTSATYPDFAKHSSFPPNNMHLSSTESSTFGTSRSCNSTTPNLKKASTTFGTSRSSNSTTPNLKKTNTMLSSTDTLSLVTSLPLNSTANSIESFFTESAPTEPSSFAIPNLVNTGENFITYNSNFTTIELSLAKTNVNNLELSDETNIVSEGLSSYTTSIIELPLSKGRDTVTDRQFSSPVLEITRNYLNTSESNSEKPSLLPNNQSTFSSNNIVTTSKNGFGFASENPTHYDNSSTVIKTSKLYNHSQSVGNIINESVKEESNTSQRQINYTLLISSDLPAASGITIVTQFNFSTISLKFSTENLTFSSKGSDALRENSHFTSTTKTINNNKTGSSMESLNITPEEKYNSTTDDIVELASSVTPDSIPKETSISSVSNLETSNKTLTFTKSDASKEWKSNSDTSTWKTTDAVEKSSQELSSTNINILMSTRTGGTHLVTEGLPHYITTSSIQSFTTTLEKSSDNLDIHTSEISNVENESQLNFTSNYVTEESNSIDKNMEELAAENPRKHQGISNVTDINATLTYTESPTISTNNNTINTTTIDGASATSSNVEKFSRDSDWLSSTTMDLFSSAASDLVTLNEDVEEYITQSVRQSSYSEITRTPNEKQPNKLSSVLTYFTSNEAKYLVTKIPLTTKVSLPLKTTIDKPKDTTKANTISATNTSDKPFETNSNKHIGKNSIEENSSFLNSSESTRKNNLPTKSDTTTWTVSENTPNNHNDKIIKKYSEENSGDLEERCLYERKHKRHGHNNDDSNESGNKHISNKNHNNNRGKFKSKTKKPDKGVSQIIKEDFKTTQKISTKISLESSNFIKLDTNSEGSEKSEKFKELFPNEKIYQYNTPRDTPKIRSSEENSGTREYISDKKYHKKHGHNKHYYGKDKGNNVARFTTDRVIIKSDKDISIINRKTTLTSLIEKELKGLMNDKLQKESREYEDISSNRSGVERKKHNEYHAKNKKFNLDKDNSENRHADSSNDSGLPSHGNPNRNRNKNMNSNYLKKNNKNHHQKPPKNMSSENAIEVDSNSEYTEGSKEIYSKGSLRQYSAHSNYRNKTTAQPSEEENVSDKRDYKIQGQYKNHDNFKSELDSGHNQKLQEASNKSKDISSNRKKIESKGHIEHYGENENFKSDEDDSENMEESLSYENGFRPYGNPKPNRNKNIYHQKPRKNRSSERGKTVEFDSNFEHIEGSNEIYSKGSINQYSVDNNYRDKSKVRSSEEENVFHKSDYKVQGHFANHNNFQSQQTHNGRNDQNLQEASRESEDISSNTNGIKSKGYTKYYGKNKKFSLDKNKSENTHVDSLNESVTQRRGNPNSHQNENRYLRKSKKNNKRKVKPSEDMSEYTEDSTDKRDHKKQGPDNDIEKTSNLGKLAKFSTDRVMFQDISKIRKQGKKTTDKSNGKLNYEKENNIESPLDEDNFRDTKENLSNESGPRSHGNHNRNRNENVIPKKSKESKKNNHQKKKRKKPRDLPNRKNDKRELKTEGKGTFIKEITDFTNTFRKVFVYKSNI